MVGSCSHRILLQTVNEVINDILVFYSKGADQEMDTSILPWYVLKVKISLDLIKHHAMKTCRGVVIQVDHS
jgi:hypothetical protein